MATNDKIILVGNPNIGKSALFSRLTGAKVMVSNYPGTTVEFLQGRMKIGEERPAVIDAPGTYTLRPTSKAEEVTVQILNEGGRIVNVIDATNLERNLHLTLELLERGAPTLVVLNMWDETKHLGITIDLKKLEAALGVPVVATCALTGEGIKELVDRLPQARPAQMRFGSDAERWEKIGRIVEEVQTLTHHDHTLLERLEDLSIRPVTGLPIAAAVLAAAFFVVRAIGEFLGPGVLEPLFESLWLPVMTRLGAFLGEGGIAHQILIGGLIDGQIDFGQSFGLLTTGLFVPIAMVLPYICSFYLVLGLLEDFGYLPRLAVLMDNFMHRMGLHGYAVIPLILGLGCNVPGALATRVLEGRREKFIAAALMAVAVPCMAQTAMIIGLVGQRGGRYVLFIFGVLFVILVVKGFILNRVMPGASPEILVEIPPYRIPQAGAVLRKLWFRLVAFLREALPLVILGVLLVNVLYALKVFDALAVVTAPVFTKLWGLPQEVSSALIVGFLRKDVAIGMLGPLGLTTKQLVIASTILAVYFPCMATFVVLVRELGAKDMAKIAGIMILTALIVGTILNFVL